MAMSLLPYRHQRRRSIVRVLLVLCLVTTYWSLGAGDDSLVAEVLNEDDSASDSLEDSSSSRPSRPQGFSQRQVVHPLTDMPDSHPGVKTKYYFPQNVEHRLPIGEPVTILCHFRNEAETALNVTFIMGSLNAPHEFSFHLQNFSYKPIQTTLPAGYEATFEYMFTPHRQLEAMEFQIAHTIFYVNEEEGFSNTFFNRSVELYHQQAETDLGALLRTVLAVAVLVILAMVGIQKLSAPDNKTPPPIQSGGKEVGWGDDFLGKNEKGGKAKKKKNT